MEGVLRIISKGRIKAAIRNNKNMAQYILHVQAKLSTGKNHTTRN